MHSEFRNMKIAFFSFAFLLTLYVAYFGFAFPDAPSSMRFENNRSAHYTNAAFSINWTGVTNASNYTIYVFNNSVLAFSATNSSATGYLFSSGINGRNYTFNVSAVNSTGVEGLNATSGWIIVDTETPSVSHISPPNGLNTSNSTVYFLFNATDNAASELNCSLYIDSNLTNYNITTANGTATALNVSSIAQGAHFWNITCIDYAQNNNTASAYYIGIDRTAPEVALNAPANDGWISGGKTNFTYTPSDFTFNNCSLWTNTTGTWALNSTNNTIINGTQNTFRFDSNTLPGGRYIWNVRCFDNASNAAGWASSNFSFIVGTASDFVVSDLRLINSSAAQYNNPVPGSNITINATILNNGTANAASSIIAGLYWDGALITAANISNETLTQGSEINLSFTILGGNVTGFGAHTANVYADYANSIVETNETNNNRSMAIFSGLNITANMSLAGLSVQTPNPGDTAALNITVLYQNGSAVAGLVLGNFTIYDIYAYDNGTTTDLRSAAISGFNGSQNASGIYSMNITAPAKSGAVGIGFAEYGNHSIHVFITENKSVSYSGWDNRSSNYYTLLAPNLAAKFGSSSYSMDLKYDLSADFSVQIKNNGTSNMTNITLTVVSNSSSLTITKNSVNYSTSIACNYTSVFSYITNSSFVSLDGCTSLRFNTTAVGSYKLTLNAGGFKNGNASDAYNATAVTAVITVTNSTNTSATPPQTNPQNNDNVKNPANNGTATTYKYSLEFTKYNSTVLIEQGKTAKLNFSLKNTGNGTIRNISFSLANLGNASWKNWYYIPKAKDQLAAGATAVFETNITVPENASIATYKITAKAIGIESGSTKSVDFTLQVVPGAKVQQQINLSLSELESRIASINATISELMKNGNNTNVTLAYNKLKDAERLLAEAKEAIRKGDYLSAYNAKADIEKLIQAIIEIVGKEKTVIDAQQTKKMSILAIVVVLAAIGGLVYYMWLPQEGYIPQKGYAVRPKSENPLSLIAKKISSIGGSAGRAGSADGDLSRKYVASASFGNAKQSYAYAPHQTGGLKSKANVLMKNISDQFSEYKKTDQKYSYDFHKKSKWASKS